MNNSAHVSLYSSQLATDIGTLDSHWQSLQSEYKWKEPSVLFSRFAFALAKFPTFTFPFRGKRIRYFHGRYNMTWRNERAVELAIARDFLRSVRGRVLEVGNVCTHYFPVRHDVVDKYEKGPRVFPQDITTFRPQERYDAIISISTLEHVGLDEEERDPAKPLKAIDHLLRHVLKPGGKFLATFPLGYNPTLDIGFFNQTLAFDLCTGLIRTSRMNHWREGEREELRKVSYGEPFIYGNGIVVGTLRVEPEL